MNPWDYLAAIRHRWMVIVASIALVMIPVAIWCWTSPRLYRSSATLLFGGFEPGAVSDKATGPATPATLGTQANVIASDMVAQQVVARLGFAEQPQAIERWRAEGGKGTLEGWLADNVLQGLTVEPTKNANVLRVSYRSADPDAAAAIANAFADAFVKTQLMLRIQPARVYSDWFRERTADVRQRLERAQAQLTRYQREHGLIGGDRADVEMNRLTELSTQLTAAEAASAEAQSRAGTDVTSSPDVQSSAVVQSLRAGIATTTVRLNQLSSTYGRNYPDVVAARAELAALQAQLAKAVGTAARTVQVANAAAQNREGELRRRVAEQRAHVLALSGNQDQLAVLQRDVDTAKAQYDAVTQRLNAVRLQSELPQADATLLDRASPTYMPISPNVPLRLLLGLFLGGAVGVSLALLLEWLRPRFRTDGGLEQLTGLPVLASFERRMSRFRLGFQR